MFGRNKRRARKEAEMRAPNGLEIIDAADVQSESTAVATVSRLFGVYQPGVIFSEPTSVGDHTVITASEVHVAMGVGFGSGSGGEGDNKGAGSGGGGGGGSAGRPVAAIVIGPNGVQVEPIVDVTKIALAFFTTLGAMYMTWRALRPKR